MHEKQTRLAGEVVADLEEFLDAARGGDAPWAGASIFSTAIRRNIKLAECPSYGKTIFDYDPSSHGAMDYNGLAEEFLAFFSPKPTAPGEPAERIETIQTPQAAEPVEPEPGLAQETPEPVNESPGEFHSETEPTDAPLPTTQPVGGGETARSNELPTAPIPPQPLQ